MDKVGYVMGFYLLFYKKKDEEVLPSLSLPVVIRKYPVEKTLILLFFCLMGNPSPGIVCNNLKPPSSEEISLAWHPTGAKVTLEPSLYCSVVLV